MGLFSKKAKPAKPGSHKPKPSEKGEADPAMPAAGTPGQPVASAPVAPPTKPGKPGKPEKPAKAEAPRKPKKGIDPSDFIALRAELADVRSRLEASEQAKAIVESRLAALDATTTAMSTGGMGGDDLRARLHAVETQLVAVTDTATAANITAEAAAAKATTAATVATEATAATAAPAAADPVLSARVEELASRLGQLSVPSAPAPDPALAARVEELAARLEHVTATPAPAPAPAPAPDHTAKLGELEARIAQLAATQAAPSLTPLAAVPDPDTLARLDALAARAEQVDHFAGQIAQLNARVTAQAELGAQLGTLRDRITELQNDQTDRRTAALAATGDADLRDRVNAIADRLSSNEALLHQLGQMAERVTANDVAVRQSTEQVQAMEQRLNNVATELANQIGELGRDIDGLANTSGQVGQGSVSDEVLDALRSAQVKLANEQARYEIAFRQDLAALAEQVRHGRA